MLTVKVLSPDKTVMGEADGIYGPAGNSPLCVRGECKEKLSQARASALVLRLADSLFVSPFITIPEAQRILGVKQYHTARKSIEKLISAGILKQIGESSYGKTFVAEEILQTIGEGTKQ